MSREVVLIDLSSILHQQYHITSEDPDPNMASRRTVAEVRRFASGKGHVAICCDVGSSFRRQIDPLYKAQRRQKEPVLFHQIERAADILRGDGFPVWAVPGFEADDLIATATERAIMSGPDVTVTIISADKDLLQLVGERVCLHRITDGKTYGPAEVQARFGVTPAQIRDYLTLVGDKSDNIPGCPGIGEKLAAALLAEFGSLDAAYAAIRRGATPSLTPARRTALKEFESRVAKVRQLIALRNDVEIPFEEIEQERVHRDVADFIEENEDDMDHEPDSTPVDPPGAPQQSGPEPELAGPTESPTPTAIAVREAEVMPPADYERQLDPRTPAEARKVAVDLFQSRLMSAYGSPQAVLSTIMLGRELGLPAMASLRAVHIIEGKHSLSADAMVALVLKSGFAEYFEPVEFDAMKSTWETKRKGGRNPQRFTYTIEEARAAGLIKDKSGWSKSPTDMLNARAKSKLARLVYPDVVGGFYTPDELREIRESEAAA